VRCRRGTSSVNTDLASGDEPGRPLPRGKKRQRLLLPVASPAWSSTDMVSGPTCRNKSACETTLKHTVQIYTYTFLVNILANMIPSSSRRSLLSSTVNLLRIYCDSGKLVSENPNREVGSWLPPPGLVDNPGKVVPGCDFPLNHHPRWFVPVYKPRFCSSAVLEFST
jgi:hypothetical protein